MTLLIAPKPIHEFEPTEYHKYITDMFYLEKKVNSSPIAGLTVRTTAAGKLSITSRKTRLFKYVTETELEALSKHYNIEVETLRTTFKGRKFIIAKTRAEAEEQR